MCHHPVRRAYSLLYDRSLTLHPVERAVVMFVVDLGATPSSTMMMGLKRMGKIEVSPSLCTSHYDCPSWTAVGKRPPEPEYGHPGSAESVVPDLSLDPVVDTTPSPLVSHSVYFAESPAAMFSLFIPSDSVDCLLPANPCILMLPVRIPEGKAPRVMASIDGVAFPLLLDTGGEVSVLPMDLFRSSNRLLEDGDSSRTVATFGNGAVQLFGPVKLTITLCGVTVEHPFYLVDDKAASFSPAFDGYDLMKAAHLVMDIPNGLAWSRLTQPSLEPQTPSPNPSAVELPHSHFNSSVLLVEGSDPSLVSVAEEGRDCSVCEDVAVPTSSLVESVSLPSESVVADRSSVLSHQVSVVLPPLLYGRSPPLTLVWTHVSLRSSPGRAPAAGWNPVLLSLWIDRLLPSLITTRHWLRLLCALVLCTL